MILSKFRQPSLMWGLAFLWAYAKLALVYYVWVALVIGAVMAVVAIVVQLVTYLAKF